MAFICSYCIVCTIPRTMYLNAPAPVPNLSPGKEEKRNVYDTHTQKKKRERKKKKRGGLASFVE